MLEGREQGPHAARIPEFADREQGFGPDEGIGVPREAVEEGARRAGIPAEAAPLARERDERRTPHGPVARPRRALQDGRRPPVGRQLPEEEEHLASRARVALGQLAFEGGQEFAGLETAQQEASGAAVDAARVAQQVDHDRPAGGRTETHERSARPEEQTLFEPTAAPALAEECFGQDAVLEQSRVALDRMADEGLRQPGPEARVLGEQLVDPPAQSAVAAQQHALGLGQRLDLRPPEARRLEHGPASRPSAGAGGEQGEGADCEDRARHRVRMLARNSRRGKTPPWPSSCSES